MPVLLKEGSQEVKRLQEALKSLGWDRTGPSDGIFGPLTSRGVRGFQASSGLTVDGIVGANTWAAIDAGKAGRPPEPSGAAPVVPAQAGAWERGVIATALKQLGVVEDPVGSNAGAHVNVFTGNWAVPWCALFVSWCVREQATSPITKPLPAVVQWRTWLKDKGRYKTALTDRVPSPGDVFIILYKGAEGVDSGHGHIGFIVSYDQASQTIRTVEGNTSNGVRSKTRKLDGISGWGSVAP